MHPSIIDGLRLDAIRRYRTARADPSRVRHVVRQVRTPLAPRARAYIRGDFSRSGTILDFKLSASLRLEHEVETRVGAVLPISTGIAFAKTCNGSLQPLMITCRLWNKRCRGIVCVSTITDRATCALRRA